MESWIYKKPILIFGCGNTLFGNDGFGPETVRFLNSHFSLPEDVLAMDVGTGIRDFVFDLLLLEKKPDKVIIIDAVTMENSVQGEIFWLDPGSAPKRKMADFSLHQSPSSNLLTQLKDQGVDVKILALQTDWIPNEINPGLCPEARKAIPDACDWIMDEIRTHD